MKATCRAVSTLLVLLGGPSIVSAASAPEAAAALYDEGAAAYNARRYADALAALAEADALSPNDVTLELALKAALRTAQAVKAMELAERAAGRGERVVAAAQQVRAKFELEVGKLRVSCAPCEPSMEGKPLEPGATRLVEVGEHELWVRSGSETRRYQIRIAPGQELDFRPQPSAPTLATQRDPKLVAASGRGVSPTWMWVAAGVSAALSVATVVSAIDTRAQHERFQNAPNEENARAGRSSQARTNWLFGGTLASAGATVVLGLLVVEWDATKPLQHRLAWSTGP